MDSLVRVLPITWTGQTKLRGYVRSTPWRPLVAKDQQYEQDKKERSERRTLGEITCFPT